MTSVPAHAQDAPAPQRSQIKNIGLFLISPFVGLYYALLLPGKLFQLAMNERKSVAHVDQPSK